MNQDQLRDLAIKLKEQAKSLNDSAELILTSFETKEETEARYAIGGGGIKNPPK